ncbi:MAG: hypothetical protein U9O98_04745 [Asgard group archaeon]|nr:hypothetical protein [Asgard group archaeon]
MLLECYFVDDDGVKTKVEPADVELTSDSLLIVVSHDDHYIYLFKGSDVSIRKKFASARIASGMRLQQGYKIKHIEENEGIDESFQPILDFLGGLKAGEQKELKPVKKSPAKKVSPKTSAAPPKAASPPKVTSTPSKKIDANKIPADLPSNLTKVVKTMMSLEPPEKSQCDYILVDSELYIMSGENKTDLREGKFSLEKLSTLPEGIFPAENYFPRILISDKKIVGVELWSRK